MKYISRLGGYLKSLPIEIVIGIILASIIIFTGLINITTSNNTATIEKNQTNIKEKVIEKLSLPKCIIYGLNTCPHCRALKKFFEENGINHEFRDVYSSSDYKNDFMIIIMESGLGPYVPTTIVIDRNGHVTALVQGEIREISFWKKLLNRESNSTAEVYVVSSNGVEEKWVIDRNATLAIQKAVLNTTLENNTVAPEELIPIVTSMFVLAFVDSINPCAISTAIIISANAVALGFAGKKKYLPLIMFVMGVYIGYFIVGYFASILAYYNIFLAVVIAFAIILVARDIHRLRKGRISDEISCEERECLPGFLVKAPSWLFPLLILGFGTIISWSFMLCSAAPYILFVTLLSKTVTSELMKFIFIGIYCGIIIIPILLAGITTQYISKTLLNIKKITVLRILILVIIIVIALNYLL